MKLPALVALLASTAVVVGTARQRPADALKSVDHYVRVTSTVPAIAGQVANIYVRERVRAGAASPAADRVVLFVHGAGTPAEVAFDPSAPGYSWMAYLAAAGFDVFSMDTTGYGRSMRPAAMNDPCNLSPEQQKLFVPAVMAAPCPPTYPNQLTNIGSDWNDIDGVVNYIRALRKVEQVSLVAWSLGGPRAGGYAAQHPDKVRSMVLLAPAYNRAAEAAAPSLPRAGVAFNTQSRAEFVANWDRQVGCPDQFEPSVRDAVWSDMIASDPVGATWDTGVRRAPSTTTWGWNAAMAAATKIPALIIAGIHDRQVMPERVRPLYDDLGSSQKVLIDLGCSSHNAMWEKNRLLMFKASLDWLTKGAVGDARTGIIRMGYAAP
ncbi:MAG: alpha/beta fold hydrolase [Acidobacteria bacterium]|nr:alpha/beta fold hydrolase [Acidobacteriota bacterium]MSO83221.1 alpha/beta fold hydrolase [Acidobacteriota bacterium]